jgi:hypothetical protein
MTLFATAEAKKKRAGSGMPWRSDSGPVGWFFILRRRSSSIVCERASAPTMIEEVRFAADSALEEAGFEPSGPGTRARDEPLRPSIRLSTMPLMARERANDASNRQRSSAADHSVALFPTDWIAASSSRQRGRRLGSLPIRISRKADKREDGRWYRRYVGTIRRDFLLRPDRSRQRAAPVSWCCAPASDLASRRRAVEPRGAGGTQDRLTAACADQAA